MSWGRFSLHQGATRSGMRPMGRCSTQKPAPCTVVVIDEEDGDDASDSEVFIIDDAAGYQTKKRNGSSGNVINIDDDEEVEEGIGRDKAGPSTSPAAGSPAASTPGRGSPRNRYGLDCTSDSSQSDSSEGWDSDTDDGGTSDCEIMDDTSGTARKVWETAASRKKMPHGIHESKDGRATASTSSAGSDTQFNENKEGRFGSECHLNENIFHYFSDAWKEGAQNSTGGAKDGHGLSSVPNANECSNRNVTDDKETKHEQNINGGAKDDPAECHLRCGSTSGTARKVWETAASRKKMPHGIHESKDGMATASTSSSRSDTQFNENTEVLFGSECHLDENIFRYFSDAWKEGVQNSTGGANDGHGLSSVPNANERSNKNVSNGKETEHEQNINGGAKDDPAECHLNENIFRYFSGAWKEGVHDSTGSAKDVHGPSAPNANKCSNGKETDCRASSNLDPDTACNDKTAHPHNSAVPEKAPEGIHSPRLDETFVYRFFSANRVFPTSSSADRKDGSPPMFVCTPEKVDEKIPDGLYSQKDQSPPDAHNVINKDMFSAKDDGPVSAQQTEVPPFTSRCDCSRQFGGKCPQLQANSCACAAASIKNTSVNVISGSCSLPQKDLVDDPEELGPFTLVQDASGIQGGLIGEREKHKESIEYKRAAEEEWASRQRQLQIQAEEAKKLRKRKKAQTLRLLDMEKRQKQRVQEVRESQRKNEEDIQLKEQYRSVVRKELEDTERRYRDMTSILRVLGIPVEGGEVKAAYKQALLKFHPDRVSRSDIYQQVKAEETFKFISRLKEKLPRFL
ncbi:uncharacterized protein LOC133913330 [Phragmites australis]|uniref:uncharacterized protein LOC133913330 n=1 Tax=Phragmites australis TaxID=29695 RepID=UPI002D765584|nr:uncharacterized protein LOC133913330 [Phragmites australis]